MGTKTVKNFIYSKNPLYTPGGAEPEMLPVVEESKVVTTYPKVLSKEDVLELLPASVVKAVRDSIDAAVVKQYEKFKLAHVLTHAQGLALFAFLKNKTLMDATQEAAAIAAWPEE